MNRKPLIDKACEVRELIKEDFAKFKPASEIAPELVAMYKKTKDRPEVETRKLKPMPLNPLEALKGTVIKYDAATSPVADDDWDGA